MIRFPILESLSIDGYGLYPGTPRKPGLETRFLPGLTLVLGANGLGKSTLVHLMYRMCTGLADIAGLAGGPFGSRQVDISVISPRERRTFAARVNDSAKDAVSTLTFRIAGVQFSLARELRTFGLVSLSINGEERRPTEEEFQNAIVTAAGIQNFADWILILRYLVFYSDDRGSLVWDPDAQRHILRLLFLSKKETQKYVTLESEVLQRDTTFRNLRATLSRQERELKQDELAVTSRSDLETSIRELTRFQANEEQQLEELQGQLNQMDADRQTARLAALQAEDARESAYRAVEHQRLLTIKAAFPGPQESAAYILSQLMAGDHCLVCDSNVPAIAAELRSRIDQMRCLVCDSPISPEDTASVTQEDIDSAKGRLKAADVRLEATKSSRVAAEERYQEAMIRLRGLEASTAERNVELDRLAEQLPDGEKEIRARRSEYNQLRSRLRIMEEELVEAKASHSRYISRVNVKIAEQREAIKAAFDRYATEFLLESCVLTWTSHKVKVGQTGSPVEFSVFKIDMTGTDFDSPVRRSSADEVSESQREFIDLAFRMALVEVAGEEGLGTLVMDAPEASLDAVFAPRAADVLTRFGDPGLGNRVILTSNLVEGQLVPTLLSRAGITDRTNPRIVDLTRIASPTAALRAHRDEYEQAISELFTREAS
ncbi:AAA family ATPase [Actinomadura barringtoniae]|uniref:Nuclease SbcCD subunit C n=1 Tax=Actinomadura barringtoniae TaxID=1427535 RepID=A0A939PFZ6_9ACTN|nr:AAA family ATPase [Actinomadura barringtoniae]MBO2449039.1 AAA family ATPase [Actinomadura barringtoniae]